jgi:demethylmenaquinone methyltransferase/2-methoxy-6-polyprenyl-1,4-benzoquinol methylase
MGRARRIFYNFFPHFYDPAIRLHSGDREGTLRQFMVEMTGMGRERRALDLCTGTGAVAIELGRVAGDGGLVVGLDFSRGMLDRARGKARGLGLKNASWVEADTGFLPFKNEVFDAVTCSHALYELEEETRRRALLEAWRVLKQTGRFCMMEHEIPRDLLTRILFWIRILSMGSRGTWSFIRADTEPFNDVFDWVGKEEATSGKSRVICGQKGEKRRPH